MLAQDRTKESAKSREYATELDRATGTTDESDTLIVKQQLKTTLEQNTLGKRLFTIDKQIKDIQDGRLQSSARLTVTGNAPPVTLKELQKSRKQIMKELSKLRSGNRTTGVGE
ncbi:MAG TPA: hypothetical protein EYN71_08315 [Flavobacteriales bacterium]|nr:hypothetical protein [Flavobacteriales bacterium]